MGRPTRIHFDGAIYHAMARGNGRRNLFGEDADFGTLLKLLAECKTSMGFRLLAYCLMPNHLHLLVQVSQIALSDITHWLLGSYARFFNQKYDSIGHVFNDRHIPKLCSSERYLLTLLRYIHGNPVKDGFASSMDRWPWSSHHEYMGTATITDTKPLLDLLGGVAEYKALMESFRPEQEPLAKRSLNELRDELSNREAFVFAAVDEGYKKKQIAEFLGCFPAAISRIVGRR